MWLCSGCIFLLLRWLACQSLHEDRIGAGCSGVAIWARKEIRTLIHHSDQGSHYLSIRYIERLADPGIGSSVGSVGDSYDNALAETINGLFKMWIQLIVATHRLNRSAGISFSEG